MVRERHALCSEAVRLPAMLPLFLPHRSAHRFVSVSAELRCCLTPSSWSFEHLSRSVMNCCSHCADRTRLFCFLPLNCGRNWAACRLEASLTCPRRYLLFW